ncbi:sn1-specific diacylglycerol lipase beta isoform X4 [Iris pallida]|uniref:Sn1-specific diacylglycerol lipase beta isoform X4 n=1 Tax=Iris pallida TaxID=29817 RepID=A0AAX6HNK7_IRIPA|nr:sn1-specific diacylglycerol lipase beta isoform X4 [Iris pallida]
MAKRLLLHINSGMRQSWKQDAYQRLISSAFTRYLSERADLSKGGQQKLPTKVKEPGTYDPELVKYCSDDDDSSGWKWKVELAWLSKALEPALQLYKWASTGSSEKEKIPPSSRSVKEIFAQLQLSKLGVQDWSFSDLTVGLYLIYLSQASGVKVEDFNGVQITSDVLVQELIYHIELAKGSYKDSATALARHSMLRERNVLKFVKDSSVLRPGYYIAIDTRNKLVIFGIRGTHTVYDLITDVVSTSDQEMSFEGFSMHFGTAEAAHWYLRHEMGTIRKCLDKHKDFRLRLVGHSLGGAAAALLAVLLRKRTKEELGFSPDIVSAVGFGTPPCMSKKLAESCADYVSTVVLQDDIIPRLSVASLTRLRNEILETDWMSVLEKEDWKGFVDLVTNAKNVVSSVQDVARKLADYTKFNKTSHSSEITKMEDAASSKKIPNSDTTKHIGTMPEELFIPGTMYFLKRMMEEGSGNSKSRESYTLWKRQPGEHFQRILLSGNLISDHKCDSHYHALRDVLKSLPASDDRSYF